MLVFVIVVDYDYDDRGHDRVRIAWEFRSAPTVDCEPQRRATMNEKVYEQILLRESYRVRKDKVDKRTLLNLTHFPREQVEAIEWALKHPEAVAVQGEGEGVAERSPARHRAPAVQDPAQRGSAHAVIIRRGRARIGGGLRRQHARPQDRGGAGA